MGSLGPLGAGQRQVRPPLPGALPLPPALSPPPAAGGRGRGAAAPSRADRRPGPGVAAAAAQASRFWLSQALDAGEGVKDGFYTVYGQVPEDVAPEGALPSKHALRDPELLHVDSYEAVYVDRGRDFCLRQVEKELREALFGMTGVLSRARIVALLVAERLGGQSLDPAGLRRRFRADLQQCMLEANGHLVMIGNLAVGPERHRAILFKVLADAAGVPCRLLRGEYYCGGEDSACVVIVDENDCELFVDLVGDVGNVMTERQELLQGRGGEAAATETSTSGRGPESVLHSFHFDNFLQHDADADRIRATLRADPGKFAEFVDGGAPSPARPPPSKASRYRGNAEVAHDALDRSLADEMERNASARAEGELRSARRDVEEAEAFRDHLREEFEAESSDSQVASLIQGHDCTAEEATAVLRLVENDTGKAWKVCGVMAVAKCKPVDALAWLQTCGWSVGEVLDTMLGGAHGFADAWTADQPRQGPKDPGKARPPPATQKPAPLFSERANQAKASGYPKFFDKAKYLYRAYSNGAKENVYTGAGPAPAPNAPASPPRAAEEEPFVKFTTSNPEDHPEWSPGDAKRDDAWDNPYADMRRKWQEEMHQRNQAEQGVEDEPPPPEPEPRPAAGGPPRRERSHSSRPADAGGWVNTRPSSSAEPEVDAEELREAISARLEEQTAGLDLFTVFLEFGVPLSGSSAQDIRKAYRKAALKLHPDRNRGKDVRSRIEAEERWKILGQFMESAYP